VRFLRVLVVIVIVVLPILPSVVFADTTAEVTIFATPATSHGITSFTITYINETQIDLEWTVDPTVDKVMVRAKYGEYPDDIPNENVAPSDGYLVYYGFEFSTSDTSMDFDTNLGILYYKAWAQKPNGKWYVETSEGFKESEVVTLILIFGFGLVISGWAIHKKEPVIGLVGSAVWLAAIAYTRANPIGSMTTGDVADTAVLIALIAMLVLPPIISWRLTRKEEMTPLGKEGLWNESGGESKRLTQLKENSSPRSRKETSDEYYSRLKTITKRRA